MTSYIKQHKKHFNITNFVAVALLEDVAEGDYTSLSTIPATSKGKAKLLVKESGVLAGVEAAQLILKEIDSRAKFNKILNDGEVVKYGDIAFTIEGNVHTILKAERLMLNVMQRMSGIATHTNELQRLCAGTQCKVIDTRKTTPGFRFFEKWAVVIGGGANHRFGLYDMIMIKDNHVDFAGGIEKAVLAAQNYIKTNKLKIPIEVETRTIQDVQRVLDLGGVQRIMLDNYTVANAKKAVTLINGRFEVEASGGINRKTLAKYANTGVDFISVGALTHQIKSLDLSLKAY